MADSAVQDALAASSATPQGAGAQAAVAASLTVAAYEKKHYRAQVLSAFAVVLILIGLWTYFCLWLNGNQASNSGGWNLFGDAADAAEGALTDWSVSQPFGATNGFAWNVGELILLVTGASLVGLGLIMGSFRGVFCGAFGAFFIVDAVVRYLTGYDLPKGLGELGSVDWKNL
jgi:hypothetical protein